MYSLTHVSLFRSWLATLALLWLTPCCPADAIKAAPTPPSADSTEFLPEPVQSSPLINSTRLEYADPVVMDSQELCMRYLRPLARDKRDSRTFSGMIGLVIGGGLAAKGADILGSKDHYSNGEEAAATWLGTGAMLFLIGLHDLSNPSAAEQEFARIGQLQDSAARDSATLEAIKELRKSAKASRISSGIVMAAVGTAIVTILKEDSPQKESESYILGGVAYAGSVLRFLLPGPEERMYGRMMREQSDTPQVSFVPLVSPRNVGISLNVTF